MPRLQPRTPEREIIRHARDRTGIKSDKELCQRAGIPYLTYVRYRVAPGWTGRFTLSELRAIFDQADFTDQEILAFMKGATL